MPESVVMAARKAGIPVYQCNSLDEVLADTDVLYVTRVQQERFDSAEEFESVKKAYVINHAVLARAKADMIVMHPLPRLAGTFFPTVKYGFPEATLTNDAFRLRN